MPNRVKKLIGECLSCGVAYSIDEKIRKEATSGGLVSTLLIAMLKRGLIDGALVVRNDGLMQKGVLTRTEHTIMATAGSKYLQMPLNAFLGEVIREDGKFAVVGLPCHLRGLRKLEAMYPELREKIALKIGLFCSHAVTYNGMAFLLEYIGVKPEAVIKLKYRMKMKGTTGLYVKASNRRERFIPSSKYFGRFFNFFFVPEGCRSCEDLTAECSDISAGDAWGFDEAKRFGLSLFITRNNVGENALRLVASEGSVKVRYVDPEVVVRSQKYILIKKRRWVHGNKKVIGYAYHLAQVMGNLVSRSEKYRPLLRLWLKFLGIKKG